MVLGIRSWVRVKWKKSLMGHCEELKEVEKLKDIWRKRKIVWMAKKRCRFFIYVNLNYELRKSINL